MAGIEPETQSVSETPWTEEEKEEWLAAHGGEITHVVTFEPVYQVELCIPPWEHADRHIARSAVAWGTRMAHAFAEDSPMGSAVVAAHHESNAVDVSPALRARPRLPDVV